MGKKTKEGKREKEKVRGYKRSLNTERRRTRESGRGQTNDPKTNIYPLPEPTSFVIQKQRNPGGKEIVEND